jgi:hypothetical protein
MLLRHQLVQKQVSFNNRGKERTFHFSTNNNTKGDTKKLEMGAGAGKAGFFQKSRPAFRAGSLINIDTIYQVGKADCQKVGKKPAFPAPA